MNIKEWVENNCFRKDGELNNQLTKNNGEKIFQHNPKIYTEILEKTNFLKDIYQNVTFVKRLHYVLGYNNKGWYKKESYYLDNIKTWINENLIDSKGRIKSAFIRENQQRIKNKFPKIYGEIMSSTKFLNKVSPSFPQRLWHVYYDVYYIIQCKECGCNAPFKDFKNGYFNFCSYGCGSKNEEVINKSKQTKLENHNDENYVNVQKAKQTRLKIYGDENYVNVEKAKQTKLENHDDENYNNREKSRITRLELYNDENYTNRRKAKQTCLEKYGDGVYYRTDDFKQKSRQTNLKKYGDENYVNVEKAKQTCLEKYGDEVYYRTDTFKQKSEQTCLERYGVPHPMQCSEIAERCENYRWYDYQLPSGGWIKLQGYEPYALDCLFQQYNEEDILYKRIDMPEIWYKWEDNTWHRYYPDFYIPKDNLIIEVKSNWTYNKYLDKNILKEKASIYLGYKFEFWIL